MAGLKELKSRIEAIKSTQKITSAMKMVAAAGLRRAQKLMDRSELYLSNLTVATQRVVRELKSEEDIRHVSYVYPRILSHNKPKTYLLVVIASDRGLCGNYNVSVAKIALNRIRELKDNNKIVRILCVGKKTADLIHRKFPDVDCHLTDVFTRKGANFTVSLSLTNHLLDDFNKGVFDVAEVVSSRFESALARDIKSRQFLPIEINQFIDVSTPVTNLSDTLSSYDYEPDKLSMLNELVIMLLKAQLFDALVHAQASEHGARMASMDNATRNASDMIAKLTLRYNGLRQSAITTELTEIISGAEAL